MVYILLTHSFFPEWDLYELRDLDIFCFRCDLYDLRDLDNVFLGRICMIYIFRTWLPWWDLYDLHDLRMFADCDL